MNKRGISGKADLCVSLSFSLCRRIPSWFHRIPEWFGLAVPLKAPSPPLPRAGTAPGLTSLSQFRAVAAAAFPAQALPVFWAGQAAAGALGWQRPPWHRPSPGTQLGPGAPVPGRGSSLFILAEVLRILIPPTARVQQGLGPSRAPSSARTHCSLPELWQAQHGAWTRPFMTTWLETRVEKVFS